MFESGTYVADHIDPVTEEQVQPNGVDLTVEGIAVQTQPGRLSRSGKTIGERDAVAPDRRDGVPVYHLEPGGYIVTYGERIAIPDEHIGFLLPRSSLMRNSCMLNTAVWDAGYEGRGEGLLQVHHPIEIEAGARIAQIVFARADHEGTYDGSYQGERL